MKAFVIFFAAFLISGSAFCQPNQTAIFAGGCFWCMEADFDKVKGVVKTVSGYDGGTKKQPTYEMVSAGNTNYAEAVKVIFNPDIISYKDLLAYYWHHIDPTVSNQQFCDHGKQYRSVIFYLNDTQKQLAEQSRKQVAKQLNHHIYTAITPSTHFYVAENYHQNYYKKHPLKYRFYRYQCGRDARLSEIWGSVE